MSIHRASIALLMEGVSNRFKSATASFTSSVRSVVGIKDEQYRNSDMTGAEKDCNGVQGRMRTPSANLVHSWDSDTVRLVRVLFPKPPNHHPLWQARKLF
jgi:hypothetical protein